MYFGGSVASNLLFVDNTYDIGASGATRPRNLYTSGIGLFGGTLFTQSLAIGNARIQIRDNSIEDYATDADTNIGVNYYGYQAGVTRFRDLDIYNGKSGFIATFEGATSRFGLGNANPSYTFDMIGQGRVVATGGASGATIPANNLFVVDSNANTGFGIAIPSTGNIVGGYYINGGTNQYDGGIEYQGTTRELRLLAQGANRVFVNAVSLSVGATPYASSRKSIQISDVSEGYFLSDTRAALGVNFTFNANNFYMQNGFAGYLEVDSTSGSFKWLTAVSGLAGAAVSFSQPMTLENGGNLVIGATSSASRLDVVRQGNTAGGTIMMSGSKTNNQNKYGNLTGAHYASSTYTQGICAIGVLATTDDNFVDIGGNVGEQIAANKVRFWTAGNITTSGGTQRGMFDPAGNFLVGTGTAPTSSGGTIGASNCLYVGSMSQNINYGNGISFGDVAKGLLLQQSVNTDDERVYLTNNAQTRTTSGFTGDFAYNKTSASASAYFSSVGYHRLLSAPTGTAGGTITWTTVFLVGKDTTVALQGANAFTGTGITFPGTQSQSSNANTLDDYEEGSWTPNLAFNGNTAGITYIYRTGTYVKIGRQVTVWATVYLSSKGSNTGDATFISLPYQPDQTFYNEQHGCVGELNGVTFSGYLDSRVGGTTTVNIFQNISGTGFVSLNNTNFTDSASMAFTVTYTTNA
jgi:hypothetical protein